MRVCSSVTAMTRSPSSAVRRSSSWTRWTAVCKGEVFQNSAVSPSSASGASVTVGETTPESCQLRRISGRTAASASSSPADTNCVQARTALTRRACRSSLVMATPGESRPT